MTAAALLREAALAGVSVRLADGNPKVSGDPTPELLARLRALRPTIVDILAGNACRWCGAPLAWPSPIGVVEAAGTVLHHSCYEASEVERLLAAGRRAVDPGVASDPGEIMLRGETDP